MKYHLIEILHRSNWFNSHLPFTGVWKPPRSVFLCCDANRRSINLLFDKESCSNSEGKTPKKTTTCRLTFPNISFNSILRNPSSKVPIEKMIISTFIGKILHGEKPPTSLVEALSLQHLNHHRWLIHPLVSLNKGPHLHPLFLKGGVWLFGKG